MAHKTVKFALLSLLALISTTLLAQRKSISYKDAFLADKNTVVNLNIEYSTLQIVESYNDSITIISKVSILPTSVQDPFIDVIQKAQQSNEFDVNYTLKFEDDIQLNNKLISSCIVKVPMGTKLNIKSRHSEVEVKTVTGKITSNFEYVTFNADKLSDATPHTFEANFSKIIINSLENTLEISGTNLEIDLKQIKNIKSNTKFSTYKIEEIEKLEGQSYTDKFTVAKADSVEIKSEYTSCIINKLEQHFQAEMNYGALVLEYIAPTFETINIANTHVKTSLSVDRASAFSINADIRYCMLNHEEIPLKKITSPRGTLYSGEYGLSSRSNISIISSLGDVKIQLQDH